MGAIEKIEKVSELTLDKLGEICQEEKVTVRKVCQLLYDGMNATTVKIDTEGKPMESTRLPDMPTRHKYMTSAMEVLKLVKKEVPVTNIINVEHMSYSDEKYKRLEEAINEERRLKREIVENSSHKGKIINVEVISAGTI